MPRKAQKIKANRRTAPGSAMLVLSMNSSLPLSASHGFHVLTKPVGPICNLDCKYCFYLEKQKLYPGEHQWRMSDEVLEEYVRQYIESQPVKEINFAWQGGEPTLLGVGFFRKRWHCKRSMPAASRFQTRCKPTAFCWTMNGASFSAATNFWLACPSMAHATCMTHTAWTRNRSRPSTP